MQRVFHTPGRKWIFCLWLVSWVALTGTSVKAQSLPNPAMAGPLQMPSPHILDAGPLGKLDVNGVISGMGLWQGNHLTGDSVTQGDLSNGQVFLQKTDGWWQFYVEAGAYNFPLLALPYLSTAKTMDDFYGPVPVGYMKLVPSKDFSIMIGKLPTLMGAEYPFTFQNMNIERGLLWTQENTVNRGIQVNQVIGKFTASLSWNDGYYSNRFSWLSGSLTYAQGPHSLSFAAMGNLGQTAFRTLATPVQNNGAMYALEYTYAKGNWTVQPYIQYGDVPINSNAGVIKGASARVGALLMNYSFTRHFSLAGRGEYLSTTGRAAEQAVNLLFGPGSGGWSVTLTPTFRDHAFFVRGELSLVQATRMTPGDGFGPRGVDRTQPRGIVEAGFIF